MDPADSFGRRRSVLIGAAIFVAAAALRLALVQSARFTGDEARDYQIGMDIAHGVRFPMLGPVITSGAAQLPGPFSYWLIAFPQLFSRAPEAGNAFFELMGAAAVWMFWYALRRPFGEAAATFAAALMAFSPWSALFGDRVWNPNAFLVVTNVALLAAVKLRERPGSAWAAVLPVACLVLPQLHSSAPVVWLALLPLVWGTVRRWNRRWLALGLLVAALLYIPLAIHEAQTGFGNARAFIAETVGGHKKAAPGATLSFLLSPIYCLRFLTLDVTYHELSGYWGGLNERAAWHALWYGSPARPFHALRLLALMASVALVLVAAAAALRAALTRRDDDGAPGAVPPAASESLRPFAWSALVAVVADVGLLALTSKQVFAHYVTPALPFVFFLFAAGARAAFAHPRMKIAFVALAAIVCAGGIEATLSISRRIDGRNGLAVHRAVARRVLDDCAAAGRAPADCPARLDFGFVGMTYTYGIFARTALATPIRWEGSPSGFAYSLQKSADPAPPGAGGFPITTIGPVNLYRLR
ncbi:MAG TPA: glycosyltransferase family 39 protein [Polyangia bacterium]